MWNLAGTTLVVLGVPLEEVVFAHLNQIKFEFIS